MSKVQTKEERIALFEERLRKLPVAGREIFPKGSPSCALCRRKVEISGRLLYPGAPTCSNPKCEMCKASDVSELFTTEYGRSISLWTLRTFLRCLEGPSVFVDRTELMERATDLARSFVDLEDWQWAFSTWVTVHRPGAKEAGRAVLIPPKRIDEVVRIRLKGAWLKIDPSAMLEEPIRTEVRQIRESGPTVEEVPF
jgi:hypothetical protein